LYFAFNTLYHIFTVIGFLKVTCYTYAFLRFSVFLQCIFYADGHEVGSVLIRVSCA